MNKHVELASLLMDLEAAMRNARLWSADMPPPSALQSTEPFAVDTLTFNEWLQFIFLPKLHLLAAQNLALPAYCGVVPMAEEVYAQSEFAVSPVMAVLSQIDALLEPG